jgi:RimJ/RimL family protein N-acetyltransferase
VLETNTRARRLYEAAGFEVEGVLRDEFLLAGRYVDDLLMARDLTPR